MNKKLFLYLKNELNMKKSNNREMLLYYNIVLVSDDESISHDKSNDVINDMNSLPLYYFNSDISNDINAIKKIRITEELLSNRNDSLLEEYDVETIVKAYELNNSDDVVNNINEKIALLALKN